VTPPDNAIPIGTTSAGRPRTVVVGGGMAGLVVAWELARAGLRPTVLEAGPQVGGTVARHTVAGMSLDAGAESYATATSAVADLLTDLGLAGDLVLPNPVGAWVRHAGGTAPLPQATLLGIPSRPFAADVRRVLGTAGSARALLDRWLPAGVGSGVGTLGGLVGARMGRSVVTRLVEPVAGGVYSTDPDELDVDAVQPRLRQALRDSGSLTGAVTRLRASSARPGSAVGGLAGGMYRMVEALVAAIESLGGVIRTGAAVRQLQSTPDGWQLTTTGGSLLADHVVLAVPGPAAAPLLTGLGIGMPTASADTSDVVLVTLVVDQPTLDAHPRGTGILVSRAATGVTAKALTHATAKWAWLAEISGPGRHVLRLSYGRGADPVPIQGLTELAIADAATLTGVPLPPGAVVDTDIVRWSSALPRPQAGHRVSMDAVRSQVVRAGGLHLAGSVVAGTGLAAVVADARAVAVGIVAGAGATAPNGG
jgi:oxygen-dependent protoporphyrinogen oxidase